MKNLTINCDMGEAFGIYHLGDDAAVMPYVTHANIACGFHASDPNVMWRTVRAAKEHGVKVGSHPGLPDREGFGRREMKLSRSDTAALVLYQTGALKAFLDAEGMQMSHIKPHGALMGMAMKYAPVAEGIADAATALKLPVIACTDSEMTRVFDQRGVEYACEFYADLDYDDDARQIITMIHEAVAPEDAVSRVMRALREKTAVSINGKSVPVAIDSICVHSDTPGALPLAKAVFEAVSNRL
ncbi:LamB/YcsF family protein [Caballeronia pedi]|uniref:LamB/YcsF family protein n=1 Tax=Caballeronia pedi TaxID=1777141 RepID=A0A157ZRK3_9BURK|nr:5-oxoprolinase subunit PxpA [Caballeronia pedi]SAK48164.1 LamB/YcsF family protein [Caballeronia pedi]